jgi:hypothetical protein
MQFCSFIFHHFLFVSRDMLIACGCWQRSKAGGSLYIINGNHETMNMSGDFRYATLAGVHEFDRYIKMYNFGQRLKRRCESHLFGKKVKLTFSHSPICAI